MGPPLRYFIRSLFLTCRSFCETRLSENQQQRSDQVVGGPRHVHGRLSDCLSASGLEPAPPLPQTQTSEIPRSDYSPTTS